MDRGAVALIDALGFKGVWGDVNRPSTKVLETLKTVGDVARNEAEAAKGYLDGERFPNEIGRILKDPFIRVVQLSDTVVIAAGRRPRVRKPWAKHVENWKNDLGLSTPQLENAMDAWLRYIVCRCVCAVLKAAALCDLPLIYRGAITVGNFAIQENFILGPAVDEAAELMALADGPFVWLSPGAGSLTHTIREPEKDQWASMTISYKIPLKEGRHLKSFALNPFVFCDEDERRRAKRNALRVMASQRIDVAVKRSNAQDFYQAIETKIRVEKYKADARESGGESSQ